MPRYIDAEPFDKMCAFVVSADERPVDAVFRMIYEAPTEDVAPVVHGKWNANKDGSFSCSVCKFNFYPLSFEYCPHCGARMDGEV